MIVILKDDERTRACLVVGAAIRDHLRTDLVDEGVSEYGIGKVAIDAYETWRAQEGGE